MTGAEGAIEPRSAGIVVNPGVVLPAVNPPLPPITPRPMCGGF